MNLPKSRAITSLLVFLAVLASPSIVFSQGQPKGSGEREAEVSPAFKIERGRQPVRRPAPTPSMRSIDGSGNNLDDPEMGATLTQLLRRLPSDYSDGIADLSRPFRPSAREISNAVNAQYQSLANSRRASDYLWQWGQFVDHDIDLTDGTDPPEPANIPVPIGDPYFDPDGDGDKEIALNRSIYDLSTGTDIDNPRQQVNEISGWIDASNVYGSDAERATALRTNDGTGRLKTSDGDLLPFNTDELPNAGGSSSTLFLAGDVRANEQVALTALHTLFVREHNRLAARFAARHPDWDGERIYQMARRMVGAEMQVITYSEYLPALLGPGAIAHYQGYNPDVDARIANLFSAAAYRYGHSALSPTLLRLDADGNEIAAGHLALRNAFFSPQRIIDEGGIDPLLRGLAWQYCQAVDLYVVDEVRNFLFGLPGDGGFDLASLNIQRGRDHGLPSYNDARQGFSLGRAAGFADLSSDPDIQARLAAVYDSVEDVDLWVGGLAEDPLPGSHLGPLFSTIIVEQFEALRDGDRFWYALTLTNREIDEVEGTRLADVIRRNTSIGDEISDDVFYVPPAREAGPRRPKKRR